MRAAPSRQEQLAALLAISRVIPVITIHNLADAVPLARALVAGGVRLLEVTLRTEAGLAAAVAINRGVPGTVIGIGTVLTPGWPCCAACGRGTSRGTRRRPMAAAVLAN